MRQRTRTRRCRPLALAAALVLAAPAWGQDAFTPEDFQRTGLYLSGFASFAIPMEKRDLERDTNALFDATFGPGTRTEVDESWGVSAHVGYRLHERFAVETQFEWLSSIELDSELGGGGSADSEISLYALTGNLKAFLLTGRIQPYVLAGAGWGQSRFDPAGSGANERDDGFVTRLGAGIDLYGSPDVAFSVETSYVLATGALENLDYVSIGAGLMLRFYSEE